MMGQASLDYLTEFRMQQAAQLLREQSVSLSEIAAIVGYDSYNAFAKAFRKRRACTPNHYRKLEPNRTRLGNMHADERHLRRSTPAYTT
ncbi:helix-turn-helix domain-containing protein [Sphingomonas oleivorans]|nr:helix-turn-helix domain-containing protein [Sphingomonas oleivorans]